jgi:hypothetical protein
MSLLDEQLVDEWLNRQHFFTMRGIKCGVDEIDLLAMRQTEGVNEFWHVEVQASFRPIGYIGGDTNARKRTDDEIKAGVEQWVKKKFTSDRKVEKRNLISPNAKWRYVLVHAVLRDVKELEYMKELGVDLISYKTILKELRDVTTHQSSSVASNITDILVYLKENEV